MGHAQHALVRDKVSSEILSAVDDKVVMLAQVIRPSVVRTDGRTVGRSAARCRQVSVLLTLVAAHVSARPCIPWRVSTSPANYESGRVSE